MFTDAPDRVSGRIRYASDLQVEGMLHTRLLRSTSPHARIVDIDTSRARALPGVVAVVTGQDILAHGGVSPFFGPVIRDQPMLAIGKVRYVGEPVVAVVAEELHVAEEAVSQIVVEYDDLTPVLDAASALADGAPTVHDKTTETGPSYPDIILNSDQDRNICNQFRLRRGDAEAGFERADHIFEDTFSSPPVQHVPMETHTCIARFEADRLVLRVSNQTPSFLRAHMAEIFGLPEASVRIVVPNLGGSYGAKSYAKIEPLTAYLALVTGRPVRVALTREEQAISCSKHGVEIRMKTGVMNDGELVAREVTCLFDTGAYADIGPRLIKNGGYVTVGPYNVPNVAIDSYAVYTNLPPAGAFRGYGVSQAAWAHECQMDIIAERLGIDPLELRARNLIEDGDRFATGEVMHDCQYENLLRRAARGVGWDWSEPTVRSGPRVRAKGLSCVLKSTVTPTRSDASASLGADGTLNVLTSSVEMGQGVKTAIAILAAERLGLPIERVKLAQVDTDVTPYDQSTSSSRSTFSMGAAVSDAVDVIKDQLLQRAAELLEAGVHDLEIADGAVVPKGVPERALAFEKIIESMSVDEVSGAGEFQSTGGLDAVTGQGVASVHWHQAAVGVEVEVDLDTGAVTVLDLHCAAYAGRVVNPVLADLQIHGNVTFGLGQALSEGSLFDHGQIQNANLGDYLIPSIKDLPANGVTVDLVEHPDRAVIHGLGESSLPPVMPAIGNAVYRATGVRITDLPITPEKVLRGLRASG